jgi:hypothetical protein
MNTNPYYINYIIKFYSSNILYMETNIKVIGFSNKRINGKTLDNKGFDLDYDGDYLDVNAFDNNRQYYTRLDNQDIMHLLNIPSSQMPLEQRIMQFNMGNRYDEPLMRDSMYPLIHRAQPTLMYNHNQTQKPTKPIMYYKNKPKIKRKQYKTKRMSLSHKYKPIQKTKTRKLTYARVSSIKPISSYKKSKKSQQRISKKIIPKSIEYKPISSIRQTIY